MTHLAISSPPGLDHVNNLSHYKNQSAEKIAEMHNLGLALFGDVLHFKDT